MLMDLFYPKPLADESIHDQWLKKDFDIDGRIISLEDKRSMQDHIEHRSQIYTENNNKIEIETQRRYFSPEKIKTLLEEAGFHNITFALDYNHEQWTPQLDESNLKDNFMVQAEK